MFDIFEKSQIQRAVINYIIMTFNNIISLA